MAIICYYQHYSVYCLQRFMRCRSIYSVSNKIFHSITLMSVTSHELHGFSPADSPHKGQWRGDLMFSLICAWTNGWANNRDAGYLRCHCAHYDVTVMYQRKRIGNHQWPKRLRAISFDFVVITVAADGLAPPGARSAAGTSIYYEALGVLTYNRWGASRLTMRLCEIFRFDTLLFSATRCLSAWLRRQLGTFCLVLGNPYEK